MGYCIHYIPQPVIVVYNGHFDQMGRQGGARACRPAARGAHPSRAQAAAERNGAWCRPGYTPGRLMRVIVSDLSVPWSGPYHGPVHAPSGVRMRPLSRAFLVTLPVADALVAAAGGMSVWPRTGCRAGLRAGYLGATVGATL